MKLLLVLKTNDGRTLLREDVLIPDTKDALGTEIEHQIAFIVVRKVTDMVSRVTKYRKEPNANAGRRHP